MNDLVRIDTMNLTMSSLEIAELTGKEHKHVTRDIRTMLVGLYGDEYVAQIIPEHRRNRQSEFVRENADLILSAICGDGPNGNHQDQRGFAWERDERGYVSKFILDKSHSMTLVSGYVLKLRKKIMDRWMVRTQARIAVAEFDKRADFVIWDYDSSQDELSAMNHCDIVFMHINHSSHTTKYKLNAIKANVVNVCGAATSLRDAVARYLAG